MDSTRTLESQRTSKDTRQGKRQRQAERRLADLSFSRYMAEHNARQARQ